MGSPSQPVPGEPGRPQPSTPLPWKVRTSPRDGDDCFVEGNEVVGRTVAGEYRREIMGDEAYPGKPADAAFIVYAANTLPSLASQLRELQDVLRELMDAASRVSDDDPACGMIRDSFERARALLKGKDA